MSTKRQQSTFWMEGSPLYGKPIPAGWDKLDFNGKRIALVNTGLAHDVSEAASLMGKHAAAVKKYRKQLDEHKPAVRTPYKD